MTSKADLEAPAAQEGRQPRALYLLFATEMWERFSYYGMRAILVLYMLKALHFTQEHSSLVYAWYSGLVYLTPLLGGFLADRVLGYRPAIILGALAMAAAQFLLALGTLGSFYAGLSLLILGNGFFKPNISTLVGKLYREGDRRRDAGFTIFYMGINVGAMFSPLVCGQLLGENPNFGFSWGFAAAGVGMVIGTLVFVLGHRVIARDDEASPSPASAKVDAEAEASRPLTGVERGRISAILLLGLFTIFFWAAFEQAGNTMTLWADEFTERTVFGVELRASAFQSVNPVLVLLLAPLFASVWRRLGERGLEPKTPLKMAGGLTLLGLGFLPLVASAFIAEEHGRAGWGWLVFAYFLHTSGELCLSPVGLSLVTKLAPPKLAGLLMGVWFLAVFLGNFIAGYLGSLWNQMAHTTFFAMFLVSSLGAAALLFVLLRPVQKLMAGVH